MHFYINHKAKERTVMLYHFYSRLKIELKLGSDARGKGKF